MAVTLNANEYFTGLVNYILFLRLYATNTSKRQQSIVDQLATETLTWGDRKAFMFAEMPKVGDYSQTSSLLTDASIKYDTEFIGSPIKKKISLTRIEPFLKMAMMSSSGMAAFSAYILGLMDSAKYDYLYSEIMKDLISWTPSVTSSKEMKQEVSLMKEDAANVTALELNAIQKQNQARIEKQIQKCLDDLSIFTDVFIDVDNKTSSTNFKTAVNINDLIYIGNAKFLNDEIVDFLARILKPEMINSNFKMPRVLKVPQRTFDANSKPLTIGFLVHKHWYQWFYHFNYMGSFLDIDTMRIKNVLHFWYSKGRLKHLPAIMLTAKYPA